MKIFIATPCAHEVVTSSYAATLFHLARNLGQSGIETHFLAFSHSDLEVSRSVLASMVLDDRSYTHLLFIDSDMSFSASLLERMLVFDRPFVSAIYTRRSIDLARIVAAAGSSGAGAADADGLVSSNADYVGALAGASKGGKLTLEVRDGFARAEHTGMGVTLLQRSVLETMVEKRIVDHRADGPEICPVPYYNFFHKLYAPDGRFWSEDISFCMRWTERCGGEIWACVDEEIGHRGTYKFTGTYIDRLKGGRT